MSRTKIPCTMHPDFPAALARANSMADAINEEE